MLRDSSSQIELAQSRASLGDFSNLLQTSEHKARDQGRAALYHLGSHYGVGTISLVLPVADVIWEPLGGEVIKVQGHSGSPNAISLQVVLSSATLLLALNLGPNPVIKPINLPARTQGQESNVRALPKGLSVLAPRFLPQLSLEGSLKSGALLLGSCIESDHSHSLDLPALRSLLVETPEERNALQ